MDREEVKRVMGACQILWPSSSLYPDGQVSLAVDTWHVMLNDLDLDVVLSAAQQISASGERFAPAVGVLRRTAIRMVRAGTGEIAPPWFEASAQVIMFIAENPPDAIPVWSHPAIGQAVAAIGWQTIRGTDPARWVHLLKTAYESIAARLEVEAERTTEMNRTLTRLNQRSLAQGEAP